MSFFVYLLESTSKSTYIGATVDLDHRLRQHNGEIAGGAHATHIKVLQGHAWERVCHIRGFPDWKTALQFEWAFKHHSRKWPQKMYPLERRLRGLHALLQKDRATSTSIPFVTYPEGGPEIVWEIEEAEVLYNKIKG